MVGAHNVRTLFVTAWLSWVAARVSAGNGTAFLAVQPLILVVMLVASIESGR
jgi:hypothetical protein